MTLTQWLAIWFIASVVSAPFIGNLLHKRRVRLNSQECRRLETLCNLADEWDNAPTDKERVRIYRKAEALGLCDPPVRVFEGAFMDSENEQPHKPAA